MLSCSRREASTSAPQSLTLLNGALVLEQAKAMTAKWIAQQSSDAALVNEAWRQVLARSPRAGEVERALRFLKEQTQNSGSRESAVAELARALLNLNEFIYVD
jgi:hypothetical protein